MINIKIQLDRPKRIWETTRQRSQTTKSFFLHINEEQKPARKSTGPADDQGTTRVLRGDMDVTEKIS